MTKGPQWMALDVGDYLKNTTHLQAHEHGAYMLLIMRYWQEGGLPADENLIRRYSLLSAEQWIESRPVLAALFDEGWKHRRVERELAKAAEIISKRSARAVQQHSARRANAVHEHSTGTDTRVPPLPEPIPNNPPSSVPDAAEARDLFGELWEAFPQNPSSSEGKGRAAFERLNDADRAQAVAAAQRYAKWFAQDCVERDRTVDAGLRFVPHLAKWLDSGEWREASRLVIKGEADPSLAVVHKDSEDFAALKRLRGVKEIAVYSDKGTITVPKSELDQARAQAVH